MNEHYNPARDYEREQAADCNAATGTPSSSWAMAGRKYLMVNPAVTPMKQAGHSRHKRAP